MNALRTLHEKKKEKTLRYTLFGPHDIKSNINVGSLEEKIIL